MSTQSQNVEGFSVFTHARGQDFENRRDKQLSLFSDTSRWDLACHPANLSSKTAQKDLWWVLAGLDGTDCSRLIMNNQTYTYKVESDTVMFTYSSRLVH